MARKGAPFWSPPDGYFLLPLQGVGERERMNTKYDDSALFFSFSYSLPLLRGFYSIAKKTFALLSPFFRLRLLPSSLSLPFVNGIREKNKEPKGPCIIYDFSLSLCLCIFLSIPFSSILYTSLIFALLLSLHYGGDKKLAILFSLIILGELRLREYTLRQWRQRFETSPQESRRSRPITSSNYIYCRSTFCWSLSVVSSSYTALLPLRTDTPAPTSLSPSLLTFPFLFLSLTLLYVFSTVEVSELYSIECPASYTALPFCHSRSSLLR